MTFCILFPFTWDLLARRRVLDIGCRQSRRSWCPALSRPCTGGNRSPGNRTSPALFSYITQLYNVFKLHRCMQYCNISQTSSTKPSLKLRTILPYTLGLRRVRTQSRQSNRFSLFFSSPNCPPLWFQAGHTRLRERGWGVLIPTMGQTLCYSRHICSMRVRH
jgi:hypothetical protein